MRSKVLFAGHWAGFSPETYVSPANTHPINCCTFINHPTSTQYSLITQGVLWRSGCINDVFLTSGYQLEVRGQLQVPATLIPKERVPSANWIGGWVGPQCRGAEQTSASTRDCD
jgi:hypothetical protein